MYKKKETVLAGSPFVNMRGTLVMANRGVGQLCVLIKGIDKKVGEAGVPEQ